jgi:hypothetical protein
VSDDPLGSFREQLVHGVSGVTRRRRRRRAVVGGAAAALAITVGAVAVNARRSGEQQVTADEPTTSTSPPPPDGCPVTRPPEPGFSAPDGWPAHPPEGVWYGTADLWTQLPTDGSSPSPRKSVWWSANFPGGGEEEKPEVSVIWRRLDDPTAPGVRAPAPGTNAYTPDYGWFMIARQMEAEGFGCWEVTASYKGHELSYVYEEKPRLWVSPTGGGHLALIQGEVRFNERANCYLVGDAPVVWPPGTTVSDDGRSITLSDGTRIGVGDHIAAAGGFGGVEAVAALGGVPEACLPTPVNIAFLNLTQPFEVTP